MPYLVPGFNSFIASFVSANGGASWSKPHVVSAVDLAANAGGIRSQPLPSAQEDASGKVYVVWEDCRFRAHCRSNDIVLSTSVNGTTWTRAVRVPIGKVTDDADHMLPGIGIRARHLGIAGQDRDLLLLLSGQRLWPEDVPAGRRLCVLGQRRQDMELAHPGRRPDAARADRADKPRAAWWATTSAPPSLSGRAFALIAAGLPATGHKQFNEPMEVVPGGEPVAGGTHAVQPAVPGTPAAGRVPAVPAPPRP